MWPNGRRLSGAPPPVRADSLAAVIERAEGDNAALLVVELDTPGGLDSAMRQMVQGIIQSRVPVAVYVSPPGAPPPPRGGAGARGRKGWGGRWRPTPRPAPGPSPPARDATPTGPRAPCGRAPPSPGRT